MCSHKTELRHHELRLVFEKCPPKCFDRVLELGAGAGVQTIQLFTYCRNLTSSDIDPIRFDIEKLRAVNGKISYIVCDAEAVSNYFDAKSFDLVFSSNLMEHLPDPVEAFRGIYHVLGDDGVSICIMPSVFMKILYLVLFYPAVIPGYYKWFKKYLNRRNTSRKSHEQRAKETPPVHDNNPKWNPGKKKAFSFFPQPHGAYKSNTEELFAWREKRWKKLIEDQGFKILKTIKMPVTTGYSFRLKAFCRILGKLGFTSSYAYVGVKKNSSKYRKFWGNQKGRLDSASSHFCL